MLLATRVVTPGAAGPNRLEVDLPLLANAQPHLRDLRLLDAQQREVGYLLMFPEGQPRWIKDGRLLPIAQTKNTSGWEVDLGRAENIDRVHLGGLDAPFLKRVTIEGSGDRARWTLLAEATVFNLPENQLRRTDVEIEPGRYRYLRVVFDDRSSARVMLQAVHAREHESAARLEPARVNVPFTKRAGEPGKSRYRIHLPGPNLPLNAIEIDVASGNVYRNATVTEPRLANGTVTPADLGTATLRRAERSGGVATEMVVPIGPPEGRELDLVIDDGNNPPLTITAVRARLTPQPWIYFESRDGAPLRAQFGDPKADAPRYDLEASRADVSSRKVATAQWSGGIQPSEVKRDAKDVAPLGAMLEREQFRISRKLPDAPAGLTVLILDADVLARASNLDDVRLADASGRQVPYLVEQRAEPLAVKLAVPPRGASGRSSIYKLALPYADWPAGTRLVLTTTARVFEREVTLRRVANNHRNRAAVALASAPWRTADPELLPPPLSFDFAIHNARAVEVMIDEGDNAPLPLTSAQLLVPSSALRFHHPGTSLFLLYGNRRAAAPRYDIALLAPRLFGAPARELTMPAAAAIAHRAEEEGPARKLFWVGIAVAAVVLIVMLVRLLRAETETSHAPSDTT